MEHIILTLAGRWLNRIFYDIDNKRLKAQKVFFFLNMVTINFANIATLYFPLSDD